MGQTSRPAIVPLLAAAQLAVAAVASAGAQEPNALSESYRDWTVRCQTGPEQGRRCWMVQTLVRQEGGERILQLEFAIRDGETSMVMLAPFGLLLAAGATLAIDGERIDTLAFRTCLPAGCVVDVEPGDALLSAMRAGKELTVDLRVAATEEPLALVLSLQGFTAAHNRLRALASP